MNTPEIKQLLVDYYSKRMNTSDDDILNAFGYEGEYSPDDPEYKYMPKMADLIPLQQAALNAKNWKRRGKRTVNEFDIKRYNIISAIDSQ